MERRPEAGCHTRSEAVSGWTGRSLCLSDTSVKLLMQCCFQLCLRQHAGTWASESPLHVLENATDKAKENNENESGCS